MTESKTLVNATCPECRGPLTDLRENGFHEYQCLVGHRYSVQALLQAHSETQERMLWAAVVALEEAAVLARDVASQFPAEVAERLIAQGEKKQRQGEQIRGILQDLDPFRPE
jgi:two-component system chemotaxis response regulator CheB